MTGPEWQAALATLGISQLAAGRWLGVTPRTAHNWAKHGCKTQSAVMMVQVALAAMRRWDIWGAWDCQTERELAGDGDWLQYADLAPLLPTQPSKKQIGD